MGLDIYFEQKRRLTEKEVKEIEELSQYINSKPTNLKKQTDFSKELLVKKKKRLDELNEVLEVGYFRKVNFLVDFFFIKNGIDINEILETEVTQDDLKRLVECCDEVLSDRTKASTVLPTCSGFFFGSTSYDEYYFSDVAGVKSWAEKLINDETAWVENSLITIYISY